MSRRYTPADELAAREAFIAHFLMAYGADLDLAAGLNLPPAIVADLTVNAGPAARRPARRRQGKGRGPVVFTGPAHLPVRNFTVVFSLEPPDVRPDTPPKKRYKYANEEAHAAIRDGHIVVHVDNLSAALEAAPEAVRMMWAHLKWPLHPQPYPAAERDAVWLFEYWCKGTDFAFIGVEDSPRDPPTERAVKAAVEGLARRLGFDLTRRPPKR